MPNDSQKVSPKHSCEPADNPRKLKASRASHLTPSPLDARPTASHPPKTGQTPINVSTLWSVCILWQTTRRLKMQARIPGFWDGTLGRWQGGSRGVEAAYCFCSEGYSGPKIFEMKERRCSPAYWSVMIWRCIEDGRSTIQLGNKDAAPSPAGLSPRKERFEQVAGCAAQSFLAAWSYSLLIPGRSTFIPVSEMPLYIPTYKSRKLKS